MSSAFKKFCLYAGILLIPLIYYPLMINGQQIDIRKIREIAFYSVAIIISTFLEKSQWLRVFIIWCVVNWWLNFFIPREAYIGLTNVFTAFIFYISLKYILKLKYLKFDILLIGMCLNCILQAGWYAMQRCFHYDPIFYGVSTVGDPTNKIPIVGFSGNPATLAVFLASLSFLFLHYLRVKKIPILFFFIAITSLTLRNATAVICLFSGGLFYVLNKCKSKKIIINTVIILLLCVSYLVFIERPNFDRGDIWKEIIKRGFVMRPVVGKGISFFSHLLIIDRTGTPWREAHNDYLQCLLELGSIGFILMAGVVIGKFTAFFKSKRTNLQICIMSCLTALLTSGFSTFPFHLAQISFTVILLVACLENSYETEISQCAA